MKETNINQKPGENPGKGNKMPSYTIKKMSDQLRKDLKIKAAKNDISMNKAIIKAIEIYTKKKKKHEPDF